ncbi:hypothetical protein AB0I53_08865 [Saccharopolyspora sp. NPDC050389]|uniref:hypothetical protein n=1 Tax=Saccharopolyspora sp. NPDC050389 TaxID=3155516 RepID=UPI0033D79554
MTWPGLPTVLLAIREFAGVALVGVAVLLIIGSFCGKSGGEPQRAAARMSEVDMRGESVPMGWAGRVPRPAMSLTPIALLLLRSVSFEDFNRGAVGGADVVGRRLERDRRWRSSRAAAR